jgi:hypothetical protein
MWAEGGVSGIFGKSVLCRQVLNESRKNPVKFYLKLFVGILLNGYVYLNLKTAVKKPV